MIKRGRKGKDKRRVWGEDKRSRPLGGKGRERRRKRRKEKCGDMEIKKRKPSWHKTRLSASVI